MNMEGIESYLISKNSRDFIKPMATRKKKFSFKKLAEHFMDNQFIWICAGCLINEAFKFLFL